MQRSGANSGAGIDRRLYDEAVSRGIDYDRCDAGTEHLSRPVELLATATSLTPALVLVAPALTHEWSDDYDDHGQALRLTRAISAGLVRLTHWAREVHARDVGDPTDAWIADALAMAGHLVDEQRNNPARTAQHLDEAATYLANAIVALQLDRLAVADCITQAQAAWLATYAQARSALNAS